MLNDNCISSLTLFFRDFQVIKRLPIDSKIFQDCNHHKYNLTNYMYNVYHDESTSLLIAAVTFEQLIDATRSRFEELFKGKLLQ